MEDLLSFAEDIVSPDVARLLKSTCPSDLTSRLKLKPLSLPSSSGISSRSLLDLVANDDIDAVLDAVTDITRHGCLPLDNGEWWYLDDEERDLGAELRDRKPRSPNRFQYEFGDVASATWHIKFLAEGPARTKTETLSLDRTS